MYESYISRKTEKNTETKYEIKKDKYKFKLYPRITKAKYNEEPYHPPW